MTGPSEPVRVVFCRSGGMLPGRELETTVSAADLDEPSRVILERHLAEADVEGLAAASPVRGPGADMYQYDLTVERGTQRLDVLVSQTAVPEKLKPLVRWLEQRATEGR